MPQPADVAPPRRMLACLLAIYVVLAASYGLSNPLFEAPDEYLHFAAIDYLARTGSLPPQGPHVALGFGPHPEQPWQQMSYHAPLYYLLSAQIVRLVNPSDFDAYRLNPHAAIGQALAKSNANRVAHTGGPTVLGVASLDPWTGAGLAARLVRGFSVALGGLTLLGVFWLAAELFPRRTGLALLAALVVMLNPQFLYISAAVSDDNLVVTLTTLALALLLRIARRGPTLRLVAALSVLAALAALTKENGMLLYPSIVLGLAYGCLIYRVGLRRAALYAAVGLAAWLIIAGWWYLGNVLRYGTPSLTGFIARWLGPRRSFDWPGEMNGLYLSFWGLFGWFNVSPPASYYWIPGGLLALSGLGLAINVWRRRGQVRRWLAEGWIASALLGLYALAYLAAWLRYELLVLAGQGRLWFPLLGLLACLIAAGLSVFPRIIRLIPLASLALAAISFPLTVIAPAYTPDPPLASDGWQPPAGAVEFRFREPWKDQECLSLWAVPPRWDGQPKSPAAVTLYWQPRCPVEGYWSEFAHWIFLPADRCVAGDTSHVVSQVDTMPQGGRLPFPAFRVRTIVRDELTIRPARNLDPARQWHIQIGLYDAGGTGIRAVVRRVDGLSGGPITIGPCGPDSVLFQLQPAP